MDRVGNTVKNGFDIWQIQIHFFEKNGCKKQACIYNFCSSNGEKNYYYICQKIGRTDSQKLHEYAIRQNWVKHLVDVCTLV